MTNAADATARSVIIKQFATDNFDSITDAQRTQYVTDVNAVITNPTTYPSLADSWWVGATDTLLDDPSALDDFNFALNWMSSSTWWTDTATNGANACNITPYVSEVATAINTELLGWYSNYESLWS